MDPPVDHQRRAAQTVGTVPDEVSPGVKAAFAHLTDFDPHGVEVKLAATILIVDDRPDLHVMMLRRRARSEFVGGMMVFPGGGLDREDEDPLVYARFRGIDDATASAAVGVEHDGLAFWVAVIRETFEECGVLLASNDAGEVPAAALDERLAVDRGDTPLHDVLVRHDLSVDATHIARIARWITPVGPPRRYDTWFFLCAMPPGQDATSDGTEAEHLEWVRPSDGLDRWRRGEYVMLPPTVASLQQLAQFRSAGEMLRAYRGEDAPWGLAKVVGDERGTYAVLLPGDPGYDDAVSRTLNGWIRLVVPAEEGS
jgi:8-oxo-dGTP pyrophosphatase MutT (NUDIX family)